MHRAGLDKITLLNQLTEMRNPCRGQIAYRVHQACGGQRQHRQTHSLQTAEDTKVRPESRQHLGYKLKIIGGMLYANQIGRPFSNPGYSSGSNRYRGTTRNVIDEQRQAGSLANFSEVISQACLWWFAVIGGDHEDSVRAGLLRCR